MLLVETCRKTEIRQLDMPVFVDQDIVWFNVRMHDVTLAQKAQGEEQLMSVGPHGADVQTDVFTEPLDDFSQVHANAMTVRRAIIHRHSVSVPHGFKDETQVATMFEGAF